jgi:hypothetical protein
MVRMVRWIIDHAWMVVGSRRELPLILVFQKDDSWKRKKRHTTMYVEHRGVGA